MINDPDAISDPEIRVLPTDALLEKGHPGEILPGKQRDRMAEAARAYVKDASHDPEARERVNDVWLEGKYRPAWQLFTPRKDKHADFG